MEQNKKMYHQSKEPSAMAQFFRDHPALVPFRLQHVRLTGRRIGSGAYGSVVEGEVPGAMCAVKQIHDIFLDRSKIPEKEIECASNRFVLECRIMSTLHHPRVVLFLGLCQLPNYPLPALVMELLFTSLHDLLETQPDVPLALKRSILSDVAGGISYLHLRSPPLAHRDLSAMNVLLDSAMRAKIGDMGMARIIPKSTVATMTKAPGASIYMPPEAMEDDPKYGMSIDVFSLGVVAIFTLTQQIPMKVLARVYRNEQRQEVIRSELERRGEYMQLVYSLLQEDHPLVMMIKKCLETYPEDRPQMEGVIRLLEQAQEQIDDAECHMNRLLLVQTVKEQNEQIETNEQHMMSQSDKIKSVQRDINALHTQIQAKEQENLRLRNENRILKLQSQESISGDSIPEPSKEPENFSLQNADNPSHTQESENQSDEAQPSSPWLLQIKWRRTNDLPFGISCAQAIVENGLVYIGGGYTSGSGNDCVVTEYNTETRKHTILPRTSVSSFGLAAVDHQVVCVGGTGGSGKSEPTTIPIWNCNDSIWVTDRFPSIPERRGGLGAVGYRNHLITLCGYNYSNIIEVLDCASNEWYTAPPTPIGGQNMTTAIAGDHLYLSSYAWKDNASVVFSTHLPTLILTAKSPNPSTSEQVWKKLSPPPVRYSTLLAYKSHLLSATTHRQGLTEPNKYIATKQKMESGACVASFQTTCVTLRQSPCHRARC